MVQYARPISDDANTGTWAASSGSNLWACLDEWPPDSADYISDNQVGYYEAGLSSVTDPSTGSAHIVRYQYWRSPTNRTATLAVSLYSGSTLIAGPWSHVDPGSTPTTASQTLSSTQADNIGADGYASGLKIRFELTAVQNTQAGGYFGWGELEVPDPPEPPLIVSASAVAMAGATKNPTVVFGTIQYTPTQVAIDAATKNPTALLGTIQYVPAPAAADVSVASGSVLGVLRVTPVPAKVDGQTKNPTVVYGTITYGPSPAQADVQTKDPTALLASLLYTPSPSEAGVDTKIGAALLSTFVYTPSPSAVTVNVVDPLVVYGSLTHTPTPASADADSVNPTVFFGSVSVTPDPVAVVVLTDYGAFIGGVGQKIIGMGPTITGLTSITL